MENLDKKIKDNEEPKNKRSISSIVAMSSCLAGMGLGAFYGYSHSIGIHFGSNTAECIVLGIPSFIAAPSASYYETMEGEGRFDNGIAFGAQLGNLGITALCYGIGYGVGKLIN